MEKDKLKKICIITGGAGGIGYHLSEGFNKKGYKVIVLDIKKQEELSEDIDFIKVDLRLETEIKYAFSKIVEKYGTAHIRKCLNLCVNLSNFSRLIDLIFFNFNSNIFFKII